MAYLEILNGPHAGRIVELSDELRLGRNADNDLCLRDSAISRYHARILRHDARFVLEDLDSRNGTMLRGVRIASETLFDLAVGDVILVGNTRLRFHTKASAPEVKEANRVPTTASKSLPAPSAQVETSTAEPSRTRVIPLRVEDLTSPTIVETCDVTSGLHRVIINKPHTSEEAQQACQRLQAMCQMNATLSSTTDLPTMMSTFLDCLLELYPQAERAFMLTSPAHTTELELVAGKLRHETCTEQNEPALSHTIVQTIKTQKCAILSHDVLADPRFSAHDSIMAHPIRSLMCAPLLVEDELFGLIQLDSCSNQQPFIGTDLELLTAVCAHAALSVKQAHLLSQLKTTNIVLKREIAQRQEAEAALHDAYHQTEQVLEAIPSILIGLDPQNTVIWWNTAAEQVFGLPATEILGCPLRAYPALWNIPTLQQGLTSCGMTKEKANLDDLIIEAVDGTKRILGLTLNPMQDTHAEAAHVLIHGADITQRKQLERQLAQAQKLEAIGQLAAGVAHEINTPMQFVSDNLHFLQRAFGHLQRLFTHYDTLLDTLQQGQSPHTALQEIATTSEAINLRFLREQIPEAFVEAIEGTRRVAEIIYAMKSFSHPGTQEKTPIDLNKAITMTLTVARNEWKYIAEVKTELDPALPLVPCLPGEVNQVILNLIVNAAHSIGDVVDVDSGEKGLITIRTRLDDNWAIMEIVDTGTGIPADIQERIFDPFFTTKEVGKGTGQGLAIAHNVIVNKHGGTLTFETEAGRGTAFYIGLPLVKK